MIRSDSLDQLAAALVACQAELPAITKTQTAKIETRDGGSYRYAYADLADIVATVGQILSRHGLAVSQLPSRDGLVTILLHSSGQFLGEEMSIPPGLRAQELGSAVTYARRYAYCAALGIVADEDDDGRAAQRSSEQGSREATRPGSQAAGAPPAARSTGVERQDQPALPQQLKAIGILFGDLGVTDRAVRLSRTVEIAGRAISSSKQLTRREAALVVQDLEARLGIGHDGHD